jgi:outer membrane protein assembly factor BamD
MDATRFDGPLDRAPRRTAAAWLALVFGVLLLAGCNLLPEQKDETAGWSAERLYKSANDEMKSGNYTRAVKLFETLEARFPYGRYAQQAILEGAYSSYRAGETAAAIAAADRFIRTYPNHPNVDYAYYLKGLVHFREDQGLLGYVYETDLSERDPKAMKESFNAFKELAQKFPDGRYAEDARARMRYLSNALGMYEVHVARYYYNRGAYVAAVNRAQAALVNYPRTPSNEAALDILVRGYEKLEMPKLAEDSRRVLQATYPQSAYLSPAPAKPWWKLW